jgi:hypothetical protein
MVGRVLGILEGTRCPGRRSLALIA